MVTAARLSEGRGVVVLGVGTGRHQVAVRDVTPVAHVLVVGDALRLARADDRVDGVREQVRHLGYVGGVRIAAEEDDLETSCGR